MLSTPACWSAYGQALSREYQDRGLFAAVHRLTVDAYALQHPGRADEQRAARSVRLHYVSLHLVFEFGLPHPEATAALGRLTGRTVEPPPAPPTAFAVTVRDVLDAGEAGHAAAAESWARCAYDAWSALRPYAAETAASLGIR